MNVVTIACADEPAPPAGGVPEDAVSIPELCIDPSLLVEAVSSADRVVLLLHDGAHDLAAVQSAVRSIGVDPLGAQLLTIESLGAGDRAKVIHTGAAARAAATRDAEPEHARPVSNSVVSRRSFLRPPRPAYAAVPAIDRTTCAAGDGCKACVAVCPQEAYRWVDGRILFNKDACEPCGQCVTACPAGAIVNPVVTPEAVAAEVEAITGASAAPVGIRFVCSRGHAAPADGWFDVTVPCTSMVPGSWLLTTLLLGAGATRSVPCAESGCSLGLDARSARARGYARSILAEAGLEPELVPDSDQPVGEAVLGGGPPLVDPFTTHGAVGVMLAVAALGSLTEAHLHDGADTGLVRIDTETCTLCTQCVPVCPTGALTSLASEETMMLSFDHALCTGCAQCLAMCPEIQRGAISLTKGVDVELLRAGPRVVNEGRMILCEQCGKPVAPAQAMDRIAELLGDEFDETMRYLNSRCMECRGT